MIIPQRYVCDTVGCGAVHTEANGWYAVQVERHGLYIFTWEQAAKNQRLERSYHFCGQTHALQFVSAEMGSKKEGQ